MQLHEFEFERRYKELDSLIEIEDTVVNTKGITNKIAKTPEGKQLVISTFCHHNRDAIEQFKKDNIVKFYRPSKIDLSVGSVMMGEIAIGGRIIFPQKETPIIVGTYSRDQRAIIAYYNEKNKKGTWTTKVGISLNRSGDTFENRMGHDIAMYNLLSGNYMEFESTSHKFDGFLEGFKLNLQSAAFVDHKNAPLKLLKIIESWEENRKYLIK